MRILFLATYFPRPLNPTIGTWALEQAKAFRRASAEARSRVGSQELGGQPEARGQGSETVGQGSEVGGARGADVTAFRVVSGNPWFPKMAGRLKAGIRAYSDCPRKHFWDGVEVDYLPMLFYPFGKLDGIFNRLGEPLLRFGWFSIRGRLMKIVKKFQPDVVYAHHTVPNGYFAFRIHKLTAIPFVVTDHEMSEITACEKNPARRSVYEKVVGAAHRMVSVAGVMRRDMERVFPQARCEVIHNGINLARAPSETRVERPESSAAPASTPSTRNSLPATAPQALKPSTLDARRSKPLIILSCGMFYERKNFPGLIAAFNMAAAKYPNVILRILGDGPDRVKVKEARDASPFNDRIEMPGKVGHVEVLRQMQAADVFALIGWREPFATVFLEAMGAGLPVIACNDGGIAEVIVGVELPDKLKLDKTENLRPANATGILVPPQDIPAAARALEFLLSNPENRRAIGAAAKRKIRGDLTWDAVVQSYLKVFPKDPSSSPIDS